MSTTTTASTFVTLVVSLLNMCYMNILFFRYFQPSRKLKRLNLGGNELTAVPQKALSIFDNLKKLEIQENKIRVIKEGDFEGKCKECHAHE